MTRRKQSLNPSSAGQDARQATDSAWDIVRKLDEMCPEDEDEPDFELPARQPGRQNPLGNYWE